ncbi:TetR/AcrR family transcriptional regulator [Pseudodesulfovibrio tunisiensis]|uniref:TetR/AcrR family transcriptional regulator n=1 Tax=Pseudodesulfovibrio tunisiensis TaxID=463192 RepID=UPI001FB48898|nr:TetR/AcrR family transcriptional regulator [Pseudodesulfovibrio tunisiensis]
MSHSNTTFDNLPDEKQQRIIDEATREFAEYGYHQASVNRIVTRLGIAKGSLFKYFGTKQGLFEHLFDRAVAQFKGPLKAARGASPDRDVFRGIEQSLLAGVNFIESHPMIYRIYLKMLFQENFPMREKFLTEVRKASAKYLRPMVEQGIASGQLRPDLDTDMAIHLLDSVMDRFLQSWSVPHLDGGIGLYQASREDVINKAAAVTDMLRCGLGNTASAGDKA